MYPQKKNDEPPADAATKYPTPKTDTEQQIIARMNHWRTVRIMHSNTLAQGWQGMSTKERQTILAECKYAQAMITRAIQDLRTYRTTGQLPKPTDENTDIEDITDLAQLLRLKKNARSTLSKAHKNHNQKQIEKWQKIIVRIETRQKTLIDPT